MRILIGICIGIYIATIGLKSAIEQADAGIKKTQEFIVEKHTSNNSNSSK